MKGEARERPRRGCEQNPEGIGPLRLGDVRAQGGEGGSWGNGRKKKPQGRAAPQRGTEEGNSRRPRRKSREESRGGLAAGVSGAEGTDTATSRNQCGGESREKKLQSLFRTARFQTVDKPRKRRRLPVVFPGVRVRGRETSAHAGSPRTTECSVAAQAVI